jgi:hypothetical protein
MTKFFSTALANMGSPEPHTAHIPRPRSEERSSKPSSINKFFSHAFSGGGLLGAPEAYISIPPRRQSKETDKFQEAVEDSFTEEYLGRH